MLTTQNFKAQEEFSKQMGIKTISARPVSDEEMVKALKAQCLFVTDISIERIRNAFEQFLYNRKLENIPETGQTPTSEVH